MDTWMKYVLGFGLPLFAFMVAYDTAGGFYSTDRDAPLSYVVAEPEELEPAEIAAEAEPAEALAEPDDGTAERDEQDQTDPSEAPVDTANAGATTDDAAPLEDDADVAGGAEPTAAGLTPEEMAAGERAARACASCHQLERDRNVVGPHLVGVGGRPVGSVEGFRYSEALQALKAEGAVWDAESIEAWLEDPSAFAPGTLMNFNVRDAEERRLIAGWLAQRSVEE